MNIKAIAILSVIAVAASNEALASANDASGSSRSLMPKRPMLRKARADDANVKESQRDGSIPLVLPVEHQDDRMLVKCSGDEETFRIDLTTDNYGFETSWKLEALNDENNWNAIESNPPAGSNYADNSRYIGVYCLSPGQYKFTIVDKFKDGMCCTFGEGAYAGFVGGAEAFSSPDGHSKWRKRRHRFTISAPASPPPTARPNPQPSMKPSPKPSRKPTSKPSNKPTLGLRVDPKIATCSSSERRARLQILTDKYGSDTSWYIRDAQTGSDVVESDKVYGPYEEGEVDFCLEDGREYEFVVRDKYSDGICCSHGEGHYKVYLEQADGSMEKIISGGNFKLKEIKHNINLTQQIMTDRDVEWLESHNMRREEWHERYNKTYVPLKWSSALAEESQVWADYLLANSCKDLYHDPNNQYGENLASNYGTGSWGEARTTDAILTRFVENEADDEYPANSHLTQVVWRSTKYVGCAESSAPKAGGGMCRVQACRYARTGNCNMNKYKKNATDWWLVPMLMDDSTCGPKCPPEGCY